MSALCLLAVGNRANAELGGAAGTVETDRRALSASVRSVKQTSSYTVHELQAGPAQVREYVSSSGVVFGVAWSGRAPPDLSTILGSYASEFQEALKNTPRIRGQRSRVIKSANVTVVMWGHGGNIRGRAFVESHVPSGVNTHEIK